MTMLRHIARILGLTIKNFFSDSCLRYSASLSFYALFSLAPVVMISAHAASLFAAEVDFQRELVQQFSELVGEKGANGIAVLLESLEDEDSSGFRLFAGALVLMFSATNIFVQLQDGF